MHEIRIEARIRNNRLWFAIHSTFKNVAQFCRAHGFSQSEIGQLLNLKETPLSKNPSGGYRQTCKRLAEIFKCDPEFLFPIRIYNPEIPKQISISKTLYANALQSNDNSGALALPFDQACSRDLIARAISNINDRSAKIIRLRYGLNKSRREMTLKEVGKLFKLSSERVRQWEERGIRQMKRQVIRLDLLCDVKCIVKQGKHRRVLWLKKIEAFRGKQVKLDDGSGIWTVVEVKEGF